VPLDGLDGLDAVLPASKVNVSPCRYNEPVDAGIVSVLVPATAGADIVISPEVSPLSFILAIIIPLV
jgi:hypothetical protein